MSPSNSTYYQVENPPLVEILLDRTLRPLMAESVYGRHLQECEIRGDEQVLDFGCGSGLGARVIVKRLTRGGAVTCVDISDFWLAAARRRLRSFPNVSILKGDIRKIDLPGSMFDLVFIHRVIDFVRPTDRGDIVRCLAGKLKPRGCLYVSEMTWAPPGLGSRDIHAMMEDAGLVEISSGRSEAGYSARFGFPSPAGGSDG
jgi:ubiquinone/menaquinone biosynthesis C-methylase UbiE